MSLEDRLRQAEKLLKRAQPEPEKRRWLKTKCPHCRYEVQYSPKEKFQGDIHCPHCGKNFHITRLDDFGEEKVGMVNG